jgi:catechol 2,3-dioxygenase-like lactoylglutathione lyase family enzyme
MKRFHVHVGVDNLEKSVRFYSTLFGREPSVLKSDYAKWMLEEPRLNFAISNRGCAVGVNHLGFQLDDEAELEAMRAQLHRAQFNVLEEKGTNCCYAKSDKYWVQDPSGIAWESFRSLGTIPVFGEHGADMPREHVPAGKAKAACCAPSCCS